MIARPAGPVYYINIVPEPVQALSPIRKEFNNHSHPNSHYWIEISLGVAKGSDIERARHVMIESAREVEGVRREDPVEALLMEMGDSALNFRVRAGIESYIDARRVVDRVNTAVYAAL